MTLANSQTIVLSIGNSMVHYNFSQVRDVIELNKAELLERRYTFPIGKLMGECCSLL